MKKALVKAQVEGKSAEAQELSDALARYTQFLMMLAHFEGMGQV